MIAKSLLVAFVALLTAPWPARAADKEAREREAKRACLNGEVDTGVKILTDLYVDTNDPTYIFNQGRCYEQSSRYEQAIGRFREYLRKARKTTDEDRADVDKHIADCQALAQKERDKADPDRSAFPTFPEHGNASDSFTQSDSTQLVGQPDKGSLAGHSLRVGGLVLGLTGAAALIAGIALNLKYNSTTSSLEGHFDETTASSHSTYKLASEIGYASGAAAVAAGTVMYCLGWRAGRTAVLPVATVGGEGIVLTGSF